MRALTLTPGRAGSLAVTDVSDAEPAPGELLVEGVALGVCGTDREIAAGQYGVAPPGQEKLVLGHEALGRVLSAPDDSGFASGDLVAGVVRRPDPVPCGACAHGEWDMCRNGRFTERGIKGLDGYGCERWTLPPEYAARVDPGLGLAGVLTEPASVVAKAWEQVDRVGGRGWFEPERVLVTGAGPVGLLAAMIGVQRGLDVHVLDQVSDGPKPGLVRELGATYHHSSVKEVARAARPDVVIEATGVGSLVIDAMAETAAYGIVCLTGVSAGGRTIRVDAGSLNRDLVLENDCVVGSVNANTRHFRAAADALAAADRGWLGRLLTRRVPLEDAEEALAVREDDVKVVVTLGGD